MHTTQQIVHFIILVRKLRRSERKQETLGTPSFLRGLTISWDVSRKAVAYTLYKK